MPHNSRRVLGTSKRRPIHENSAVLCELKYENRRPQLWAAVESTTEF
ncbi:MAG TPA: hypothetical protein VF719_10385 [Abditibacteriaceae bacterium]